MGDDACIHLSLSDLIKLVARPSTIKGPSDSVVPVHIRWTHLIDNRESLVISTERHLAFHVSTSNTLQHKIN